MAQWVLWHVVWLLAPPRTCQPPHWPASSGPAGHWARLRKPARGMHNLDRCFNTFNNSKPKILWFNMIRSYSIWQSMSSANLQNSTNVKRKFSLPAPEPPWSLSWFPWSPARALRRRPEAWRGLARLGERRSTSNRRCSQTHRPGQWMNRWERTTLVRLWSVTSIDERMDHRHTMELTPWRRILLCSYLLNVFLNGSVHLDEGRIMCSIYHGKWSLARTLHHRKPTTCGMCAVSLYKSRHIGCLSIVFTCFHSMFKNTYWTTTFGMGSQWLLVIP